jgi:maltose O-acetyltransferase
VIGFGTIFATAKVEIGAHVYIGAYCSIGHVRLFDDTLVGSNVTLLSGRHQHGTLRLDVPMRLQPGRYEHIEVGPDAWIGNAAIVSESIGPQSIVAAGAVVVAPVEARTIVGGNPARQIGHRQVRA